MKTMNAIAIAGFWVAYACLATLILMGFLANGSDISQRWEVKMLVIAAFISSVACIVGIVESRKER